MDDISKIRDQMPVVAADGRVMGLVSAIAGTGLTVTSIKEGRGFDHVIPVAWISEVEKYVFLNKGSRYVSMNWDGPSATSGSRPKAA